MKKLFISILLLFPLYCFGEDYSKITEEDIIRSIIKNHDILLSIDSSCAGVLIEQKPKKATFGDYLAQLLAATGGGFDNQFEGMKVNISKKLIKKPRPADSFWECKVEFSVKDKESPWSYGIQFSMRATDRKVLRKSFKCPGAS